MRTGIFVLVESKQDEVGAAFVLALADERRAPLERQIPDTLGDALVGIAKKGFTVQRVLARRAFTSRIRRKSIELCWLFAPVGFRMVRL